MNQSLFEFLIIYLNLPTPINSLLGFIYEKQEIRERRPTIRKVLQIGTEPRALY